MVSPPTLQRHELGKSIHATFLYPTSFLPADTRYIRTGTGIYVPGIMKLAHSTTLSTSSLTRAVVSIAKSLHSPVIGEWRGRFAHVVPSALWSFTNTAVLLFGLVLCTNFCISIREEGSSLPEGTATATQQSRLSQGDRQQKGSCCFGYTSPGL